MRIQGATDKGFVAAQSKDKQPEQKEQGNLEIKDEYVRTAKEEKTTYTKRGKTDTATIARLKEQSEQALSHLQQLVTKLLEQQGLTYHEAKKLESIDIDEETRLEAQAMIDEGGMFSAEAVSDRIVEFAVALSGGDKGKIGELRGAIEQGFQEAARVLGGALPDISQKTYDLVMEKLDRWENEE